MLDSKEILYSKGSNDECMTLPYAVEPILKYIPKNAVIWCPFDKEDSEFVKQIKANGNKVIFSHIDNGQDFYTYEPDEHWDCIVSNPPFCFDDKTEIYTKQGWKKYNQVTKEDEVLSLNTENQTIEWSSIKSIYVKHYQGNMYNFKSKTMNLNVTPYHRMYAVRKRKNGYVLKKDKTTEDLVTVQNITAMEDKQPRSNYNWNGNDVDYFILKGTFCTEGKKEIWKEDVAIDMKDWLSFFGLWLADGYCRHTLNSYGNQRYTCGIKQGGGKRKRVEEIFQKLPFKYSVYEEKGTDKANFEIHSKQLWEYLVQFGYSKDKYIPTDIKELNAELLNILLESYMLGDSYKIKNGSICLSTISYQLSIDLQEIILKLGDVVNFTEKDVVKNNKNYGKIYVAYWNKNKMQMSKYPKPLMREYDGLVFCPELSKNGILLVRREGTICFSGNTGKRQIFERAMSFNKPFALIMSNTWLNDSAPKQLFKDKDLQLLMFDKRMKFMNNGEIQNKITFSSSYYCWNFLPKQIIMEELDIK